MTPQQFVDTLRLVVRDAAVNGTLTLVENPPGRRPPSELMELHAWFGRLSDADRSMIRRMLEMVAHHSLVGILCVLDGSRATEPAGPKGHFELKHVAADGSVSLLEDGTGTALHELT